jgi:UDP-N-acetyl-D-mannosaminuronic acid dehydrogenase
MKESPYYACIVGGAGHVGLPLGISLAQSGKKVVLYDVDAKALDKISSGEMPFMEKGADKVLRDVVGKTLFLSSKKESISEGYFLVIVIGTPVDEHLNPKFTIFRRFFSEIMDYIKDDQHIILRSTIFPGTTEKTRDLLRSKGKKTRISFCPERISEGKALDELRSLPQIVSSFDDASYEEAKDLFSLLTEDIVPLTPIEAELAKLYTNVWRYIKFSISNQFFTIAHQNGLDFHKIHQAIIHKYPRMQGFPGPGLTAGPCLLKDTMQLAAYSNNTFFLGHAAMLVNEGLPNFLVQRLKEKHPLKEKVVGILGMAFKGESDDIRDSLSYKLKKLLEIESRKVLCTDPYVKDETLVSDDRVVAESDILILAAPHQAYKGLEIDPSSKTVVDVWNFFGRGGLF